MMNFITSEKLKTLIEVNGYKFCFHKMLKNEVERWTCTKSSCKCYLKLDSTKTVIESKLIHNHTRYEEAVLKRQMLSNSLKRKATEDIYAKPSKLLRSELQISDVSTLTNKDVKLIRQNICYSRSKVHPKLPKSTEETHKVVTEMNYTTNIDENFVLVNSKESGVIGFSTDSNLKVLCAVSKIYVDGTFKSCPKFFSQVFTVHGLRNGVFIPLAFFLLVGKSQLLYKAAFQSLTDRCSTLHLSLAPSEVFIDFESAIHGAVKQVWPQCVIRGCRFHLSQCWWRKIQKLGLTTVYRESSEESRYLKMFFGLPFLPPEEVENCFKQDILVSSANENSKIKQFTDYVFQNYVSSDAEYPPHIWAQFSASINRTTNTCESFHSKLNNDFYSAHPNIYIFVDVLLGIQCETYIKSRSMAVRKSKTRDEKIVFIEQAMARYSRKEITSLQFVRELSFKFLPPKL